MILVDLKPNKKSRTRMWRGNAKLHLMFKLFVVMGVAAFVGSFPLWASSTSPIHTIETTERNPDNMRFPQLRDTRDEDDILEYYPRYLEFILECSKNSNWRTAKKLEKKYRVLKSYSNKGTAKFLSGLRYELIQRIQFQHMDSARLSCRNRSYRKWITQNLNNWYREADEHLFRAVVYKKTGRQWD